MKKLIRVLFLGFTLLATAVEIEAARQVTDGKGQPEEAQIKDRVELFYRALLKNDRISALELVAVDSKNQFLNTHYTGLANFRVAGVDVEQSGDRATARVVRVMRFPTFGQPLDIEVKDTWQRVNGQWYMVLPPPGELSTPFGKMKLGEDNNKPSDVDADAMKRKIEQTYKNVDPEQYIRALQKVAIKPTTTTPTAKPSDMQPPSPPPAATTQDDKPKTQQ